MGKGGEKSTKTDSVPASSKKLKLEHMATEELRKWAKAYGFKEDEEREKLLIELVSVPTQSVLFRIVS